MDKVAATMCLLGLVFQSIPDYPVLLFANREEDPRRETALPDIVCEPPDSTDWLGGRDLRAGGTWLGINDHGLIAAVTNRDKQHPPTSPRSRGALCRDLLRIPDLAAAAEHAERELRCGQYAGCNFLLADDRTAMVIEAGDELRLSSLSQGTVLIANAALNDPHDARIDRVRRLLEETEGNDPIDQWIARLRTICGLPGRDNEPAICRPGSDWGTVSSSIVALGANSHRPKYLYAPGPPSTTPFEDFSDLLQRLLTGGGCD